MLLSVLLLGAAATGRLDRWTDAAIPALSQDAAVAALERVQVRAAAAYAVARALGGVIAVAASTTAQGGVGVAGVASISGACCSRPRSWSMRFPT
jgi:predicted alpha/beta hydrolase family esterase